METAGSDRKASAGTATPKSHMRDPIVGRLLVPLGALLTSSVLTYFVLRRARSGGILDVPNERSSHEVPTPRGGGLAIVLAATGAFGLLALLGVLHQRLAMSLLGGTAVAAVGFMDDRRSLPAPLRLVVHLAAGLWAVIWLGGLPPVRVGSELIQFGAVGYAVGAVGIAWSVNLFNFMDGIDGIATAEAVFISVAGGAVTLVEGGAQGACCAAFAFGAACFGFLPWNWARAKIFMGDVGSGYLGYVIAVLGIAAARKWDVGLIVWGTLSLIFLADTAVTLVRRAIRGERVYTAHRQHAYQWAARRWRSHSVTTGLVVVVNVAWLLPCALLAAAHAREAVWFALLAGGPMLVLTVAIGAGRPEQLGLAIRTGR